ncbi:MAG: adenylosuccinate lyase [Bacteroidota bacterium]
MLEAISPIDGRYATKTAALIPYWSESALIKYRVKVEIEYLLYLHHLEIVQLAPEAIHEVQKISADFSSADAEDVKSREAITNHDVKAVEYFIKDKLSGILGSTQLEFIHFGLTSQDINNTAMPLMLRDSIRDVIIPTLESTLSKIKELGLQFKQVPMLARTHGQAASPTSLGKELFVFTDRLTKQLTKLKQHQYEAKFGGATGNFNAHRVAYDHVDWPERIDEFITSLGLKRQLHTTQIDQYDHFAEVFDILKRINTILIDFSRDVWTYVSLDYFKQKVIANEVGSSAMPHKVNPIDFENAEGNLGLANALFQFLSQKLPISRLQRDLTDSTVTRNVGVPLAHTLIALKSLLKGMDKLELNNHAIEADLDANWAVVAEAIQTVLRREGFEKPYELLKQFSRGKGKLTQSDFDQFISELPANDQLKSELRAITPFNYTGYAMDHS